MTYIVKFSLNKNPELFNTFKSASDYVKTITNCSDPLTWKHEFEKYFNLEVDYVEKNKKKFYKISFKSKEDFTLFVLRWS